MHCVGDRERLPLQAILGVVFLDAGLGEGEGFLRVAVGVTLSSVVAAGLFRRSGSLGPGPLGAACLLAVVRRLTAARLTASCSFRPSGGDTSITVSSGRARNTGARRVDKGERSATGGSDGRIS